MSYDCSLVNDNCFWVIDISAIRIPATKYQQCRYFCKDIGNCVYWVVSGNAMRTQQHEKIRAISATVKGDRFAVAEWEKNIQVWDINNGLICKLNTDVVSGMTNAISISEDGKHIAIAGSEDKSVTLYNVDNGEIIW